MNNTPFNNLASEYDAWFDEKGKLIFEIEVKAFQEILPGLPKPWLEVGAGSGRFAQALGIDTGVEPSIEMVKIARSRGINTFLSKGEQQVFEDASFGTVFLITTLCFLESPLDVLKEAHRIIVPGGKIVLGVILKDSPWGKYYEQKKLESHPIYKYATFYRCSDVARLTLKAGFMGERIISTLLQSPGEVRYPEDPKEGYYTEAGFVIIVAAKPGQDFSLNTDSA
ncbi:MAG: class I SAM-dependent methyltransferase [Dehalococcoidales bacterium]|nr:class I SAM-dependent methyltransferase [Dehalococcoidales bacterium]